MENQTYSRKIPANYTPQLSHKRKSWQFLISVATIQQNQQEQSDFIKQQVVCMKNENSNKKKKKKIGKTRRKINDQSRINEQQFERQQQVEKMLLDELDTMALSNIVYQHEADTTMLRFNGKKSSYSSRLSFNNAVMCKKNLRSTWFTCSLLATIFIAILLQPANSWRIFEPGTEARHALGSSSIISSNINNLFTSLPINPGQNQNQNQQLRLTPLSMQPQPQLAQSATELASSQNTRQQTSKVTEPDSASLSSRSSDSTPNNKNQQQQDSSKQDSSHVGSSIPALVGKILDATSESLVDNKNNSFGFPSTLSLTEKLTNTSSQLLKPRKSSDKDQSSSLSSKNINSVEQQIINQHANMLASHQKLMPTKQRDQKITSLLSPSSSSSFNSRNSPLNSILDTFKSSISSRSSIVKAISDNKLARTLSEVGKSISGNKYVAGAAAASAIAALGLAVSKFLSPYAFSGTPYSKIGAGMIGDPLLGSESNMRPSYLSIPLSTTTDNRNQFYQNLADPMFPAASQSSGTTRSQQQSFYPMPSGLSNDVGSQYQTAIYQAANAFQPSAFSPQQAAASDAAASSSGYLDSNFNSLAGNGNNNNRVFYTYTKGTQIPGKQPAASSLSPSASSPSPQIQPGDTGTGHYSGFYTGTDTTLSNNNNNNNNNNNQYEFPYITTGVQSENLNNNNEQQLSSGRSSQFGQIQNGNEYRSNGNENDITSSQQHTTSTPFELNSSSSFDNPISVYAQQQQQQQASQEKLARDKQHYSSALPSAGQNMFISAAANGMATSAFSPSSSSSSSPSLSSSQSTGFTSRRSGPVSLKVNDAIKERLNNLQKINNKTPQYWMTRQPTTVIELSDSDFKTLTSIDNNYKYPYSVATSSKSDGSFVPIIAASDATNNLEQQQQHVTTAPIKSTRVESNGGDQQQVYSSTIGNNHASPTNKPKRQQQQQQQQQVSYTIIRPKTGNTSGKLEEIMPEASSSPLQSATSDGGLQRSFTSKAAGASWSTVASKQIASNNNHDSNNNNDNQQISEQVVDNNQAAVSSEGGSQQQQQQQQQQPQQQAAEQTLLHRVSRTPNQSSVKQQTSSNINSSENSKLTTSGGTDYELMAASENLSNKLLPPTSSNGLKSNNNNNHIRLPYLEGSSSLNFSGDKSALKQGATNRHQQQQQVAHDDHRQVLADATNVEDNTTTNDDELKTTANLIQLSADGNSEGDQINNSAKDSNQNQNQNQSNNNHGNNNVKLIEANTSNVSERQVEISADKLADTGLVIMLPTTRNGHTSDTTERRATSMKSTGESTATAAATSVLKQRHNNKLHSTESNLNDEQQQQRGKLDSDDKRDSTAIQLSSSSLTSSSSLDTNNEEMSPDTPFGGFFGNAGYSLGGQR